MPNNQEETQFSDEIRAAFDSYPKVRTSPAFEAKFWRELDARRARYRGLSGFLRRLWEIEIEGVAVWRLALSTLSGGAVCALFFGAFALFAMPREVPKIASQPLDSFPETPRMVFDARSFYAREWEFDFPIQPKIAPKSRQKAKNGGEISWNGSNAHLA